MRNSKLKIVSIISPVFLLLAAFLVNANAQEKPPAPSAPKPLNIPKVQEKTLANKLKVAVVERKNVPLVSVLFQVDSGITRDDLETAGLANMTATLLTKGTRTRTAPQIAEGMEFLGGSISTEVGIDDSRVTMTITPDKIDAAMAIFSDVLKNPAFSNKEIELAKTQATDELSYNLKQPGFLASYVASVYTFNITPAGGTPDSIKAMNRKAVWDFYSEVYLPKNGTLIFVGDITPQKAFLLAQKFFGTWKNPPEPKKGEMLSLVEDADSFTDRKRQEAEKPLLKRVLVIDLPDAGQAAVTFNKQVQFAGRITYDDKLHQGKYSDEYFPGLVMNSILGGGYSSRLNQEIRIKRGLSYGAGSGFTWRAYDSNFSTSTQTKNISAAEVVELVLEEIEKLIKKVPDEDEIGPRKSVLVGNFQRNLETNDGMSRALAQLYSVWLPPASLNLYVEKVRAVKQNDVREFSAQNLKDGDLVIVGDAKIFLDDLKKRLPKMTIQVIKAEDLKLSDLQQKD